MRFPELSSSTAMTSLPQSSPLCSRGLWNWVTSPPSGSPQLLSLSLRNLPHLPSTTIAPLPWHLSPSNVWMTARDHPVVPRPFAVCLHSKQKYGGCYPDWVPCRFGEARMLFLDFSSAFNTVQPHLLMRKLMDIDTNPVIIWWLYSFLTGHVLCSGHRLPWRCHQRSAPTLEPLKDVCFPLCCSRCTHLPASGLPKTQSRLGSQTTSH